MIIGINGKIGSGKNTVADMLIELCQLNSLTLNQYAFATRLKKMVALLADVPYELTLTQEGKNTFIDSFNMTIGEMLQEYGTDVMTTHKPDIWVNCVAAEIKKSTVQYNIITDLRFPIEANYITKNKGITIKIVRPVNNIRNNSRRNLEHISETALDDYKFDYVIYNDGTLEELYKKVVELFVMITGIVNVKN